MKIKKFAAITLGVLMTSLAFTGCSTDGMALANAFAKNQAVNSMESKTNFYVNISATNLTDQEKQLMNTLKPMINDSKITADVKVIQNQEKTTSKVQEDFTLEYNKIPFNMSVWANMDLNSDSNVLSEIIKMPEFVTSKYPSQFKGKEFMVMDSKDMENVEGMPQINYKNLLTFSKDFQPKLTDFIGKYALQFNPEKTYIRKVGTEQTWSEGKLNKLSIYEVKLNDQSMKALLRYTVNNLSNNPDAINFVKDYLKAAVSIYDSNDKNIQNMKNEIDSAFSNAPEQIGSLNKMLDLINGIKILGNDGITIRYAVNSDGYIVSENGNAQFMIDMPGINKLSADKSNTATGIYTINLTFDTDITNINGNPAIVFPELNSSNSFKYGDLLKTISQK